MTRKDYVLLAQQIAQIADSNARMSAAHAVAAACSADNPRFDMVKFFAACKV